MLIFPYGPTDLMRAHLLPLIRAHLDDSLSLVLLYLTR